MITEQALKISSKTVKEQANRACLSTMSVNICKLEKLPYKVLYRVFEQQMLMKKTSNITYLGKVVQHVHIKGLNVLAPN